MQELCRQKLKALVESAVLGEIVPGQGDFYGKFCYDENRYSKSICEIQS